MAVVLIDRLFNDFDLHSVVRDTTQPSTPLVFFGISVEQVLYY